MSKLTIQLTDSEKSKVNAQKLDDKDLPKIYFAGDYTTKTISRDMEAFLILEDFSFKDTMVDVIKAALDSTQDDFEKELFEEAIENETKVINNQIADCNSKLGTIEELKQGLKSEKYYKFTNIPDISELFSAISSSNYLNTVKRMSVFRKAYLTTLQRNIVPNEDKIDQFRKQLQSWLKPLTKYK